MDQIKQETFQLSQPTPKPNSSLPIPVIDLSSSDSDSSDSDSSSDDTTEINTKRFRASSKGLPPKKKKKLSDVVLPKGFLDPLPHKLPPKENGDSSKNDGSGSKGCKQFWKAGDFEGVKNADWDSYTGNVM